ncbi:MFS transporter [Paenibacillus chitinolyticus]|uniref:MFS transporter n=1 Tax=Paenibacillus chitinolyticus TaxID=79263 RepID=UPI002DBC4DF4|nr:MFS transporter [Paenibacillus chitinolyticus]MEC0249092.1 MFS transporter [Paenibacillus chitinolyticus]
MVALKKQNDFVLRGFTFSYYMMMAIIASFFPLYFDSRGYSKAEIGLLYSIGPMVSIFANLAWGFASDRLQKIKPIMITLYVGQLVFVVSMFGTDSFTVLYALMAGFYFFQQPAQSLNDSQLLLHASQTGKSYSSFRIFGSIGFAFSALFFGLLIKETNIGLTSSISIAVIVIGLIFTFGLVDTRVAYSKMDFKGMGKVISSPRLLIFLLLVLIMSISHRINDGFLALHLRELGASDMTVGTAMMLSSLSEIPVFFLLGKYGNRYKELPLLAIAGFMYAIRFLIVSLSDHTGWVLFAQTMHSVTFGIFFVTALRYLAQIIPDEYRASGQAIFAVTWAGLAGIISGRFGGLIYTDYGSTVLYGIGSGLAVAAAAGFLVFHARLNALEAKLTAISTKKEDSHA